VQDRDQEQCDWPGEVEEVAGLLDDAGGVAEVGEDDLGGAGAGEQGVGVGVDNGIVVNIGDAGVFGVLGGGLVDVGGGGDAGADVEELGNALFAGQVMDGPVEEGAVGPGDGAGPRGTRPGSARRRAGRRASCSGRLGSSRTCGPGAAW